MLLCINLMMHSFQSRLMVCRCALSLDRSSAGQEQATEEDAWYNDQPAERRSDGASTSGRQPDDFELLNLPAPTNVW